MKKDIIQIKTGSTMKGKMRRYMVLALVLVFVLLAAPLTGVVSAEVDGGVVTTPEVEGVEGGAYEVTGYTLRAKVNKDHSYEVEEKISVNIPDQLQRMEFAIPSGNFRMSELKVENAEYSASKSQDASKIFITDTEKLSPGAHNYTISYRIQEYQDRDSAKDMFFFNVLLPEWKQPIGKVDIEATFPKDFSFDDMQCYAGQFGVQDATNKITFRKNNSAKTVRVTGELIPENYGITLKAQLENGYWDGALNGSWAFYAQFAVLAALVIILVILWLIGGRDPKIKKEIVTKPPEGLSPEEIGYVYNSHVGIREVLYMILDFAIKGYLRISEYEPKSYRIFREEEPSDEEKMYRSAYNILFEDIFKGRAVEEEELLNRLELIKRSIYDDVAAGFTPAESAAFTPISRVFRYVGAALLGVCLALVNAFSYIYSYQPVNYVESILMGIFAAVASLILCAAVDNRDSSPVTSGSLYEITAIVISAIPVLYVSFIVIRNTKNAIVSFAVLAAAGVSIFLIVIMRARGKDNAAMISKLRQLRHFIYHPTPKELLENHLADENYYYNMLIYALAFGAEESWAISFLTLDVKEPKWFTNDIEGEAFSNLNFKKETIDYARGIKSFVRTIENAYTDMIRRRGR